MKHLYESVFSGAMLALLVATPMPSPAQTPQAPSAAEAQAALNNQAPPPIHYNNAQIDQMLAPIALYPDQLLTQVLMASTFPEQLVDAQKWLQDPNNASLKGNDLANALQPLPWDPSVKSLVAFPQLIAMMTDHLDWTQALGTAFANQEVQVFSRVQFLRERAVKAGRLKSSPQLAVREEESDIIIEPTNPDEIYVPVYNPAEVYGEWPDRDAPPVYIPPPPNFYNGPIGAGIGFSVGLGVAAPLWGWGHPDWRNHRVDIDRNRYEHITNQTYIERNNIRIEGGAWHRSGPITFVPEAQRPRPPQQVQEQEQHLPPGTVRPSEVPHPRPAGQAPGAAAPGGPTNGPHPAGEQPHPGQQPAGQAQPGQHPGEAAHPNEAAPGPHPAGEARPNAAAPGPHPAGQAHPEEHAAPGGPAHPEEHAVPGPHPAGQAQPGPHPEHAAPPQVPHPEERAAPQAPHPAGTPPQAPHPEERAAPPQAPHPAAPAKPGEEKKDEQQH